MSLQLSGLNPLAYRGVEASQPPQLLYLKRQPTSNDYQNFNIGTLWLAELSGTQELWMLASLVGNSALWILIYPQGSTFSIAFPCDTGTATPAGGLLNVNAGNATNKTGASVKFDAPGSSNTIQLQVTDTSSNTFFGEGNGNLTTTGAGNSSFGKLSLENVTTGQFNSVFGATSANALTTGDFNSCMSTAVFPLITTGSYNIGLGFGSGFNCSTGSESSNIYLGNLGVNNESNTIRIGNDGVGNAQQDAAYFAGIYGRTVGGTNAQVIIDSTGKLGTVGGASSGFSNLFSAYLSTAKASVTGNGAFYYIPFDTEFWDEGGNFNTATGTFTAATTGRYQFTYQVYYNKKSAGGGGATSVTSGIYINGDPGTTRLYQGTGLFFETVTEYQWLTGTFAVNMTAGDTARVWVLGQGGAGNNDDVFGDTVISNPPYPQTNITNTYFSAIFMG